MLRSSSLRIFDFFRTTVRSPMLPAFRPRRPVLLWRVSLPLLRCDLPHSNKASCRQDYGLKNFVDNMFKREVQCIDRKMDAWCHLAQSSRALYRKKYREKRNIQICDKFFTQLYGYHFQRTSCLV